MNLSTPTIVRGADDRVKDRARLLVALVCAGSAGIHAGLVPAHLRESTLLGFLFAVDALLLAVAAISIRDGRREGRDDVLFTALVAALLASTAIAYLLSRTIGLPRLISEVEPVDGLGAITTLFELIGLGACLLLTLRTDRP